MKYVNGASLNDHQKREARARYIYRYTGEHKPQWASRELWLGGDYPVQFKDDSDWLANTEFCITNSGRFAKSPGYCRSNPTWPNNPELRRA